MNFILTIRAFILKIMNQQHRSGLRFRAFRDGSVRREEAGGGKAGRDWRLQVRFHIECYGNVKSGRTSSSFGSILGLL